MNTHTFILDIETTGLNYKNDKINLIGVKCDDTYFLFEELKEFKEFYNTEMLTGDNTLVAHNLKFDRKFIEYHCNIELSKLKLLDTRVLAHLFDPFRNSAKLGKNRGYGLKALVSDLFKIDYDEDIEVKTATKDDTANFEKMKEYNKKDLLYTHALYEFYKEKLTSKEMLLGSKLTQLDYLYSNITEQGLYIDQTHLYNVNHQLIKENERLTQELHKIEPKFKGVNLSSPKQKKELFYNVLNLKSDTDSTDKYAIKKFNAEWSPILLKYLQNKTILSSFINKFKDKDKIHPNFNILGTSSGRTSSSKPNLQQIPRDAKIRNLLKAPKGYTFVEIDYSQIELRIASHVADVKNMQEAYKNNIDLHTLTASKVNNVPINKVTKEMRTSAKAINFGFLYGMSASTFKEYAYNTYNLNLSLKECHLFRHNFFSTYPELKEYYKKVEESASTELTTVLGRKKRFKPDTHRQFERGSSINYPIQSVASDILQLSLVQISELSEYSHSFNIIGTVHDAVLMYVKKDDVRVLNKIVDIMENPKILTKLLDEKLKTPLKVEVEVYNDRWYGQKLHIK